MSIIAISSKICISRRGETCCGDPAFFVICFNLRISFSLSAEAVSELATVSEGEDRSDDGPDDGEDVGGDVDVGLEDGNSGVIHSIKQSCQAVPDREDRE